MGRHSHRRTESASWGQGCACRKLSGVERRSALQVSGQCALFGGMGAAPNGTKGFVLARRSRRSGDDAVDSGEHQERLSHRIGGTGQAVGIRIRPAFATEITRAPVRTIGGIDNPIAPELGVRPGTVNSHLRLTLLPRAIRKIALLAPAWGEKNSMTSSS